jgi:hypothetical protein
MKTDVPVSPVESLPGRTVAKDSPLESALPESITPAQSAARFLYPSEHSDQINPSPAPPRAAPNVDPPSSAPTSPSESVGKTTAFTGVAVKGAPVDRY